MQTIIDYLVNYRSTGHTWYFPETDTSVSAESLVQKVGAVTVYLQELGVCKGDRVGVLMNNSLEYAVLLYALWITEAVAVPVHHKMSKNSDYPTFLNPYHTACTFTMLFCDDRNTISQLNDWAEKHRIALVDAAVLSNTHLPEPSPSTGQPAAIVPDSCCFLQFSSGSTGAPKAVEVTHAMIIAQLTALESNHRKCYGYDTTADPVTIGTWLPFSHNLGLFLGVLYPVFHQSDNVIVPTQFYLANPAAWFRILSQKKVHINFFTNSLLALALKQLAPLTETEHLDLSDLQLYLGGEKVSPIVLDSAIKTLSRFGLPANHLHNGYGLSENTLSAACTVPGQQMVYYFQNRSGDTLTPASPEEDGAFALCSIGIANRDSTITIRDQGGTVLPDLTLGEINIEGPCVMHTYHKNPVPTAATLVGRRLKTGDMGFSYDNKLFYHSRKDDLIIIAGRNIVPDDCELAVERLDFIATGSAVLVMVEDKNTGLHKPVLIYEVSGSYSAEEMKEFKKTIQRILYSAFDLLVNTLVALPPGSVERTASGKKRRKVTKQLYIDSLE